MIKRLTFILLGIVLWLNGTAQERSVCGTSPEALKIIQQRLIENKARLQSTSHQSASRSQEDIYIPLKFHLVARNNGTGRASIPRLLDQMCTLNETFKDLGIQFYLKEGANFVNNGAIYDDPYTLIVETQMENIRDSEAVNIFVVGEAQVDGSIGRTLGVWVRSRDWIVMEVGELKSGGYTLAHEIGHFFSLQHPFFGWESKPYLPFDEGTPLEAPSSPSIPANQSDRILTEFADGSNCEIAGDLICDTPADYLYNSQMNHRDCFYNKVMLDPKGDTLTPDPTLIMGYFLDNCVDKFTPMQALLMQVDYESERRANLKNTTFTPVTTNITDEPIPDTAIIPADDGIGGVVVSNDELTLEWESVEGATAYFVETTIDGFDAVIVNEPRLIVPVEIGRSYFWKVRPFNNIEFCVPSSSLWKFTVEMVSSVPSIGAVDNWTVQPNPIHKNSSLYISLRANQTFEAAIQLRNLAGSSLFHLPKQSFSAGDNTVLIPTDGLEAGLYILSLENEEGVSQQKVIVF